MSNYYGYACPDCYVTGCLHVTGSLGVSRHEFDESFEAKLDNDVARAEVVINFDSNSRARCSACGWSGRAGDLLDEEI